MTASIRVFSNMKLFERNTCNRFSYTAVLNRNYNLRRNLVTYRQATVKEDYPQKTLIHHETLVNYVISKTDPQIEIGSIYTEKSHLLKTRVGRRIKPRIIWDEIDSTNSFPTHPDEVKLDLMQFLEQRDIWQRRKKLEIPKFCVGSILAVTRANQYSPDGFSRFVGICVYIDKENLNNKRSHFILRNVVDNEPVEILHRTYSPVIQKIEVLRHERWENERCDDGLLFLRDFPPAYSFIDQAMPPEEYCEEPTTRKWTDKDKEIIKQWFDAIYRSRKRR